MLSYTFETLALQSLRHIKQTDNLRMKWAVLILNHCLQRMTERYRNDPIGKTTYLCFSCISNCYVFDAVVSVGACMYAVMHCVCRRSRGERSHKAKLVRRNDKSYFIVEI